MKLFGRRGNPCRKWKSRSRLIDLHKTSVTIIERPEMPEMSDPPLSDELSRLSQTSTPPAQETVSVLAPFVCNPPTETPPAQETVQAMGPVVLDPPVETPAALEPFVANAPAKKPLALSSSEKFALMYDAFFSDKNAPLVQYQNPNGWRG